MSFQGSSVEVHGFLDNVGGDALIEIDNVATTVSTRREGADQERGVFFKADLGGSDDHTITVTWSGGGPLTFEKFVVENFLPV